MGGEECLEHSGDPLHPASYALPTSALALGGCRAHSYNALCRLLNGFAAGQEFSQGTGLFKGTVGQEADGVMGG